MALYERANKRLHHIHIPRTSGTSIAYMLKSEGWVWKENPPLPKSMQNEILTEELSPHPHRTIWELWGQSWDYEFTTVRNPYARLVSQCRQITNARKIIPPTPAGIMNLFDEVYNEHIPKLGIGLDDNHFRPQVEFIGDKTTVFRLEDQKEVMMNFLKENNIISAGCSLPKKNVSMEHSPHLIVHWPLRPLLHEQFLNLYGEDFEMFGYSTEVPTYGLNINWNKIS